MRGIRRPIWIAGIAGVALVAALLCWTFLLQGPGAGPTTRSGRESLLLIGLETSETAVRAREIVVMAATEEGETVFLILPDGVTTKRNGTYVEIGAAVADHGEEGLISTVETLLGIEITDVVSWDETGLVGVVDQIGGVDLTVDTDVVYSTSDGATSTEVLAGEQTLDGTEALAYVRGRSETPRAERLQRLLGAFVTRAFVGADARGVRSTVRSLAGHLQTEVGLSTLTDCAFGTSGLRREPLRVSIVPTETVSYEDGLQAERIQVVETERIVARLIRGIELLTASEVSVAVFNGNGIRLMASRTADYLRARGFDVTRIANADAFDYTVSYVVVLSDEAKAWVLRDALPSPVSIVFPEAIETRYQALSPLVPFGTDLLLIAGAGMEIE